MKKTDEQYKNQLTEEQYHITRNAGTEKPFTGEYVDHKEEGRYHCVCCDEALFESETKYDSGSGWPSFWQPSDKTRISEHADDSTGTRRTEVRCQKCDAHLGHVFPDGPEPTGLRYCINSVALKFKDKS